MDNAASLMEPANTTRARGHAAHLGGLDLLQALPVAIYTTDADGRITFFNEAAAELAGRRPVLGRDKWCVTWKLRRPDGSPLPHDEYPLAVALKEDRAIRGAEAIVERPDGVRVPILPHPTPLHDEDGRLVGAINMLVDISHRKEAEARQQLLFAELNHRIKNNMQMLHGLLNAAQREAAAPEARAVLSETVQRIGAIASAQQVLYLAGSAQAFDAAEFLHSVCESAHQSVPEAVSLACKAQAGQLPNDVAVPLALIVNELVVNAARHASDAAGRVSIHVTLVRDEAAYALAVEDDGPGFALSDVRRRASGLGLVAGLAAQIGGTFRVSPRKTPAGRAAGRPGARCTVHFPVET